MKGFTAILVMLCITAAHPSFGQKNEIYSVKFNFHHSRRIPDNFVSVDFQRRGNDIQVFVKSVPMDTVSDKWRETKKEYSFKLDLAEFDKVVNAVKKINCADIADGLDIEGLDGTICEIDEGAGKRNYL